MLKDKKAFLFYFLMSLIFLDFGNQIKLITYNYNISTYENSIFSICHIKNTGSAFGMFQNSAFFLSLLGIIALVFITVYVAKNIAFNNKLELFSLTVLASGIAGNVIERYKFGYVVDYIKLNFINFSVFNVFDIMICVGIFLYFLLLIKEYKINIKNLRIKWK